MPMFHTGGLNCLATPLLHNGGRVVIMPAFDAERALRDRRRREDHAAHGRADDLPDVARRRVVRARRSLVDAHGAVRRRALPAAAHRRLSRARRPVPPGLRPDRGRARTASRSRPRTPSARRARSAGPTSTCETKIVDDAGQPVPVGEVGELALGGPMVTLGYFRNADATGAGVPRHPLLPHRRPRPPRRRGLSLHRRSQEGHVHLRRREHLSRRGRAGAGRARRRRRGVRHRRARRALGRGRARGRRRRAGRAASTAPPCCSISARAWRATRSRSRSCSPTRCRATRRARCCARACASVLGLDMQLHNCYCAIAS